MIPYKDLNPTTRLPIVTGGLVLANIAVYVFQLFDSQNGLAFAMVPRQLWGFFHGGSLWPFFTLITGTFLHGSLLHIGFNLLFLWVFGDNVEDRLGHARFLLFYLAGAFVASACQVAVSPFSAVPVVGASGAISAVLGAYLVFFPGARVKTLFIIIVIPKIITLPAAIFLGLWFILQVFSSIGAAAGAAGVAWYAHIGGFIYGVFWAWRFARRRNRPVWAPQRRRAA
ncbi:MAG: rhomboid family intramembrane serine protease [Myxococcales bacterium]|nr:rhomboid family intramembrane serine protease [Myxococcales bacterium]